MKSEWHRPRFYRHFDSPVGTAFTAKVIKPDFVESHAFLPLIHYDKEEKRYKPHVNERGEKERLISVKKRPIKFASHRDACILSYYASRLDENLEIQYRKLSLTGNVIAYRALGKANYNFSAEALKFAKSNAPVVLLAFDVSSFFDNLDHKILKSNLKSVLGVTELPGDWFQVFRHVTKYSYVKSTDLKSHALFGPRMAERSRRPIGTIAEIKANSIPIYKNQTPGKGIPQGTPISAILSNVYMLEADVRLSEYCTKIGALYRRYSDDILIICKLSDVNKAKDTVRRILNDQELEINQSKTEETCFSLPSSGVLVSGRAAQYLGFNLQSDGASIRESSLSRQWRRMRRQMRRTRRVAMSKIEAGEADKVWTKKLRKKYTGLQFRNFSSYCRRAADTFEDGKKIKRQIRRFERAAEREIQELKSMTTSSPK